MRAHVVDRATGEVVGEVEAETSYGLWQALLDWGEQQQVPRFQVPARYRTQRAPDGATSVVRGRPDQASVTAPAAGKVSPLVDEAAPDVPAMQPLFDVMPVATTESPSAPERRSRRERRRRATLTEPAATQLSFLAPVADDAAPGTQPDGDTASPPD